MDEILLCDKCNVAVHQQCYGIKAIPPGNWFCDSCAFGMDTNRLSCALCPYPGGAFYATDDGKWIHAFCCGWIPGVKEVDSKNKRQQNIPIEAIEEKCTIDSAEAFSTTLSEHQISSTLEEIFFNDSRVQSLLSVDPGRFTLKCSLCSYRSGACLQCDHGKCPAAAHPYCILRKKGNSKSKSAAALKRKRKESFANLVVSTTTSDEEMHKGRFSCCIQLSTCRLQFVKKVYCARHFEDAYSPPLPDFFIDSVFPPLKKSTTCQPTQVAAPLGKAEVAKATTKPRRERKKNITYIPNQCESGNIDIGGMDTIISASPISPLAHCQPPSLAILDQFQLVAEDFSGLLQLCEDMTALWSVTLSNSSSTSSSSSSSSASSSPSLSSNSGRPVLSSFPVFLEAFLRAIGRRSPRLRNIFHSMYSQLRPVIANGLLTGKRREEDDYQILRSVCYTLQSCHR